MKPIQVFLFMMVVVLSLALLPFLFSAPVKIGGYDVRIFDWRTWFHEKPVPESKVNTTALLQLQATTDQLASSEVDGISPPDTGQGLADTTDHFSPVVAEFKIDSASGIQYPAGDSTILYSFFKTLDSLKSRKELIRILHFGDSQIEGDRITGYVRQRFQQLFGGCGPGLLPLAEETPSRFSVEMTASSMPERYVLYGKPVPAPHRNYSLLHTDFRLPNDSSSESLKLSYRIRPLGYGRANYFEKARLLFRNTASPVSLQIPAAKAEGADFTLPRTDSLRLFPLVSGERKTNVSLHIQTDSKNDFYGICLDCASGVAMDNIPLRGSSGLELLKISPAFLRDQLRQMKVKLVILQFGVNVVPYESKGYEWYGTALSNVIKTIKKARPDIQVLVIGVSDMARKVDGRIESYPNIALVKEAQRSAARQTQSAFWDLQQVMGGENSIQAWAGTEPALAGKDYIHLTPKGAQVVGEFLFQSLMKEYQKSRLSSSRWLLP